jgi:NAD(P)-dependent dehydrogenase (short-subunit alcohol dehydrogenase family)
MKKVWLITGGSKGLGLALTRALLKKGHQVITTSRNKETLIQQVGDESKSFLPVSLSLTDEENIQRVLSLALEKFGRIDVLVNNAGYMLAGAVEDSTDNEVRKCFDINVFGTLNMIRSVVPIMRQQNNGYILNTSSLAGLYAGSFEATYAATKFAINGISKALAEEVKPFNIHVVNIAPGFLRTEFLKKGSYVLPNTISKPYLEAITERLDFVNEMNGNQPGDPEKVATLYMKVVEMEQPPLELMVGSDAYDTAIAVSNQKITMTKKYEELSKSSDF